VKCPETRQQKSRPWSRVKQTSKIRGIMSRGWRVSRILVAIQALLAVNGLPSQRIEDITAAKIKKFDSGLTKIHALLDGDGSPIYDSRVAGATSLLYCLYREKSVFTA